MSTIIMEVSATGGIRALWDDELPEFAKEIGGEVAQVCRVSNVEWEDDGWVVRAAHNPKLAIRYKHGELNRVSDDESLHLCKWKKRDDALFYEHKFFHQLLPKES